ncbi:MULTISPECIES: stage II sporulation protein M [Paenibacillus]|uniref:Stage II sporulation protein M n=1 Tax=Paenibacillus azoreducens TaxID=116718 RepID=A0A919YDF3_9BACL|nr:MULTISPECIES: stage II sporulation protein M [Paenibacillus]MBE9912966.1 stage II sporulation protein M [Paenibacillus donghaensis]GIO47648.1 stage II sporulation protein M [Paenibacillus azoreducens]
MRTFRHTLKQQTVLYIFVAVLFLVGVIFGALMVNALSLEQQQDLGRYLQNFFVTVDQSHTGMGAAQSYWSIAGLHLKWVGLIWFLGLSIIGLPGILILDFLKGVLIGFTVGYLIAEFSWKGLLFALVTVAPPNLLIIPVLIVSSVSAIAFSLHVIKNKVMLHKRVNVVRPFMSYVGLTLVMCFIMLGISSFETWVTPSMMQWVTPSLLKTAAALM